MCEHVLEEDGEPDLYPCNGSRICLVGELGEPKVQLAEHVLGML